MAPETGTPSENWIHHEGHEVFIRVHQWLLTVAARLHWILRALRGFVVIIVLEHRSSENRSNVLIN